MSNYDVYNQSSNANLGSGSSNYYYDEQPMILTNGYYSNMMMNQPNLVPVYRTTTPGYEFPQNNTMYTNVNQYDMVDTTNNINNNVNDVVIDTVSDVNNTENDDVANSESAKTKYTRRILIFIGCACVLFGAVCIILKMYKK